MPDFDDIPDLPRPTHLGYSTPDAERWLRLHGSPPTRSELARRRRLALVVSVAWFAVQFAAFGVRGDLDRLPAVYLLVLSLGPASAGILALALAIRGGQLGLGTKTLLVSGLAVLAPIAFMVSAFLLPIPYEHGETGDVSFGAYCLNCSLAWALLPIAAAGLSLRGAFAAGAVWRSALLGAGCGLVAAGVFTLHCSVVGKWHLVIAHGGAVLLSAIIGAVALSWATRA